MQFIDEIETNIQKVKRIKKIKKLEPKAKYFCRVYFKGNTKEQFQIRNTTIDSIKQHQKLWSEHYPDKILIFSKIKPIKIK